jgi:hypothetical protein
MTEKQGRVTPRPNDSHSKSRGGKDPECADPDPNRVISNKLKALYNSIQDEGIPDRFLDLLEKLDEAEKKAGAANRGSSE